ncbi:MAG: molybdate ABC transporter substrate-binding protein [Betaproteobacteria bacterium]|nr:molybdate ABC transporter substrate-binding protein [Betaproteobacteria bacterium]PWB57161.1 MAG: molybdate ABC transporter substrate-binding protein [Betaproteobacteria bacterium]
MRSPRRLFALLLLLALPVAARAAELTVLAAASLKGPLDAIAADFAKAGGPAARISFAASSALARQVEAGAPADVFVSADLGWMDYLDSRGLIAAGTRANLLANELVLIAPRDNPVKLRIAPGFPVAEALGGGRIALANPASVPAGKYAKAAFTALGVWPSIEGRVAGAENVRAALALVSRGEAPLGVVYRTDAMADPGVRVVDAFPAGTHPTIVYPAAALKGGRVAEAKRFLDHLRSPAARATWERAGFRLAN